MREGLKLNACLYIRENLDRDCSKVSAQASILACPCLGLGSRAPCISVRSAILYM